MGAGAVKAPAPTDDGRGPEAGAEYRAGLLPGP
jgi:hypothetical protein